MRLEEPMRKTMEGPHPETVGRHLQHVLYAAPHFSGRFVGEGNGQHRMGRKPLSPNQPGDAVHEDTGFARARACQHQQIV